MSSKSKVPKSVSRSAKAGIVFPVGRVATYLKKGKYAKRIAAAAPVYLSAVLEYLAAEVLQVAGDHAKFHGKNRITPAQIQMAVKNDDELAKLCHGVLIPRAGALPRNP